MTTPPTTPGQHAMTASTGLHAVFGDMGRDATLTLAAEYRAALSRPPDDMWSAFADQGDPVALMLDDQLVGHAALDTDGELHRFFIRHGFEHLGPEALGALRNARVVNTMIVSTTDPGAMSVLLPLADDSAPVAVLYRHEVEPSIPALEPVQGATEVDHERATAFVTAATGGPVGFVEPYLAERIDRRELMIHEHDGELRAVGERRVDRHWVGHAHLGVVVGSESRGRGVGAQMMSFLVAMCRDEQLTPLCSTEPSNQAAQRLIRHAGFRSRDTIFRLTLRCDVG